MVSRLSTAKPDWNDLGHDHLPSAAADESCIAVRSGHRRGGGEGAKRWADYLTELRNHGVEDVFMGPGPLRVASAFIELAQVI